MRGRRTAGFGRADSGGSRRVEWRMPCTSVIADFRQSRTPSVIPAKARTQARQLRAMRLGPRFRGDDNKFAGMTGRIL
jgi:hypothetical protein